MPHSTQHQAHHSMQGVGLRGSPAHADAFPRSALPLQSSLLLSPYLPHLLFTCWSSCENINWLQSCCSQGEITSPRNFFRNNCKRHGTQSQHIPWFPPGHLSWLPTIKKLHQHTQAPALPRGWAWREFPSLCMNLWYPVQKCPSLTGHRGPDSRELWASFSPSSSSKLGAEGFQKP